MALILRPGLFVLLVCLLLVLAIQSLPRETTGESTPLAQAWTNLVQAFRSVQEADTLGAPSNQTVQLSTQLNNALEHYGNATQLSFEGNTQKSDYYAKLSSNESLSVVSKATALQTEAKNQRANEQAIGYASAIALSIISAILVTEYYRIPNFLRKRKFFKTHLG